MSTRITPITSRSSPRTSISGRRSSSSTRSRRRMRVFALGDPHLPGGRRARGMHRFGPQWWRHPEKILKRSWQTVREDDVLLLPGDLSWATKRRDALDDLAFLAALPGTKICIRGNHDFWWDSEKPLDFPGLLAPPVILGELGFAGTRGCDPSEPPAHSGARAHSPDEKPGSHRERFGQDRPAPSPATSLRRYSQRRRSRRLRLWARPRRFSPRGRSDGAERREAGKRRLPLPPLRPHRLYSEARLPRLTGYNTAWRNASSASKPSSVA